MLKVRWKNICSFTMVEYRLYNGTCGELIYFNDDFEGLHVQLWCSSSSVEQFGMWTQQGVWIVKVSHHGPLNEEILFVGNNCECCNVCVCVCVCKLSNVLFIVVCRVER